MIATMAAVLLPRFPHQTTQSRLDGYALQTAALLKDDRDAAIRHGIGVATVVDPGSRVIRSGNTTDTVRIPDDVHFVSGMSCGGAVALTRADVGYEVRVNWLTGRIEIVSRNVAN